ncbi:mCpol domain-containing protein [Deinococcus sp. ME38]|uniref:mCpol domain-containing protein n=1 Tax=Deinococcus sp. ME38 TaxID=3400344 RepID=UPI003B58CA50
MKGIFVAIDGDSVGKLIEKLILDEDEVHLNQVSKTIQRAIYRCSERSVALGAEVIFGAGDNVLIKSDQSIEQNIIDLFIEETANLPVKFSIGVGCSMTNAYLSLKIAKIRQTGIHRIYNY